MYRQREEEEDGEEERCTKEKRGRRGMNSYIAGEE
jgi:hypothetical protein